MPYTDSLAGGTSRRASGRRGEPAAVYLPDVHVDPESSAHPSDSDTAPVLVPCLPVGQLPLQPVASDVAASKVVVENLPDAHG
jgi:hypothetical protein